MEGVTYEEIIYEGYGPAGVAVMVECLTDNRNRTAADVRHIFSKYGGNLGESGCVSYLFSRKGVLTLPIEDGGPDEDTLLMEALEAGAEDVRVEDGIAEITTAPEDFDSVKQTLEGNGYRFQQAELSLIPATTVNLEEEDAIKMMKLMEALEDNDDVQDVHSNFDMDEEVMAKL